MRIFCSLSLNSKFWLNNRYNYLRASQKWVLFLRGVLSKARLKSKKNWVTFITRQVAGCSDTELWLVPPGCMRDTGLIINSPTSYPTYSHHTYFNLIEFFTWIVTKIERLDQGLNPDRLPSSKCFQIWYYLNSLYFNLCKTTMCIGVRLLNSLVRILMHVSGLKW